MEILQEIDTERMRTLRDREEFFWLNLIDPGDDDLDTVRQYVTMHDLAVEDSREFGQRAKLDDYAHSMFLVFYGAEPRGDRLPSLSEVHLHLSSEALVTVTRASVAALSRARDHVATSPGAGEHQAVSGVLDALSDSLLSALEGFDDTIDDDLQDTLVKHPTTSNRQRIFALRRQLAEMRQVVIPQRDLLAPDAEFVDAISHSHNEPCVTRSGRDEIRDVHDHLDRATRLVDSIVSSWPACWTSTSPRFPPASTSS